MQFIGTTYGAAGSFSASVLLFDTQQDEIDPKSVVDFDSAAQILRRARAVLGSGSQSNTIRGKQGANYYLTSFKYKSLAATPTSVQSLLDHARDIGTKLAACTSTGVAKTFVGNNSVSPDSFIVPFSFNGTPTLSLPEATGSSWSGAYEYRAGIRTQTGNRLADGTSVMLYFSAVGVFGRSLVRPYLGISRDTEIVVNGFGLSSDNSSYVTPRTASGAGLAYLTGVDGPDELVNIDFGLCLMPDAIYKFDQHDIEFESNLVPGTRPMVVRFRTDIIEV